MPADHVVPMELIDSVGNPYTVEPTVDQLRALAQASLDLGLMVTDGSLAKNEHVIFHPPEYGIAPYRSACIAHTTPAAYKDSERIARAVEAFSLALKQFGDPDDR